MQGSVSAICAGAGVDQRVALESCCLDSSWRPAVWHGTSDSTSLSFCSSLQNRDGVTHHPPPICSLNS